MSATETMPPSPATPPAWGDVNVALLLAIVLGGAVALADVVMLIVAYNNFSTAASFEAHVVSQPVAELEEYRAAQAEKLHGYGQSLADPNAYRIPIEAAMRNYVRDHAAHRRPGAGGRQP